MEKMDMAGLTQVTSSILISFFLGEFLFLYSCIGASCLWDFDNFRDCSSLLVCSVTPGTLV